MEMDKNNTHYTIKVQFSSFSFYVQRKKKQKIYIYLRRLSLLHYSWNFDFQNRVAKTSLIKEHHANTENPSNESIQINIVFFFFKQTKLILVFYLLRKPN